jgi:hypothetical protein
VAGDLQREVRLDGDAQVGRAAGVVAPAATGEFLVEDVAGQFRDAGVVLAAEEGEEEDVFRLEDGVALEFADPVAVGGLAGEQALVGALDGRVQAGGVGRVVPDAVPACRRVGHGAGTRGGAPALGGDGLCFCHRNPFQYLRIVPGP